MSFRRRRLQAEPRVRAGYSRFSASLDGWCRPPVRARPATSTGALVLTGVIGMAVFTGLIASSAWIYDAVAEADGVTGLDRPALDWSISARTPLPGDLGPGFHQPGAGAADGASRPGADQPDLVALAPPHGRC